MKIGDLVFIVSKDGFSGKDFGMYLGRGQRGTAKSKTFEAFLWRGRVATFDRPHWLFKVVNESR